jgi:prepilin-type N-terminal cleavage/methylation domain-containing protein/prepilin-type processing-associated H-X9-DG protein
MLNTSARKSTTSAFTLIELLVVIAIIAILAAILFPAFARARENARKISCVSNMKQLGLGIMQYSQDYDERLPYACRDDGGYPWHYTVQPYLKSFQLFDCPSYSPTTRVNNAPAASASYMCNGGGSYQTGMTDGSVSPSAGGIRPMNRGFIDRPVSGGAALAQFASSSQTILILEHSDKSGNPDLYQVEDLAGGNNTNFQNHLGMTNFLFADGHAKSLKPFATVTGVNMWTMNPTVDAVPDVLKNALADQQKLLQ